MLKYYTILVILLNLFLFSACGGGTVAQKYAGSEYSGGSRVGKSYGSKPYKGRKAYKRKKRIARGTGW